MKTGFFTIVPQCCFLFNERQSQNAASVHNPNLSALLFMVTSHGKKEPTGDNVHNVCVTIFLGFFFFFFWGGYYSKQSKHVFPHELQQICVQHMQMNEFCVV